MSKTIEVRLKDKKIIYKKVVKYNTTDFWDIAPKVWCFYLFLACIFAFFDSTKWVSIGIIIIIILVTAFGICPAEVKKEVYYVPVSKNKKKKLKKPKKKKVPKYKLSKSHKKKR